MTKRKTKPAASDPPLEPSEELIAQALSDLTLNRPYYNVKMVGSRLEFHTYGGQVLTWEIPGKPPEPEAQAGNRPAPAPPKPEPRKKGTAAGAAQRGRPKGEKP